MKGALMGSRGPVPKRSEDRKRRNEVNVTRAASGSPDGVVWPEAPEEWTLVARMLWESLPKSGQSRFYEQSDVALAFFACQEISEYQLSPKKNAQRLSSILTALSSLCVAEGDRRRVGIELSRGDEELSEEEATVTVMNQWKKRMEGM